MKLNEVILQEWPKTNALLPATSTLWGKNKVSVKEIAESDVWPEGGYTVIMTVKDGSMGKPYFLITHDTGPHMDQHYPLKKTVEAHHDQTGRKLGSFTIVNRAEVNKGGKVTMLNTAFADAKAPVLVYK